MANNPKSITKFRALAFLDSWSNDPAARAGGYDAALERLNDPSFDLLGTTVAGVEGIANGPNPAPDPMAHLGAHWLGGQYFPNITADALRTAIREGFRDAITDAKAQDLPLNVVWVRGSEDSNSSEVRVDHVVGATAVTVAIVTPAPATGP